MGELVSRRLLPALAVALGISLGGATAPDASTAVVRAGPAPDTTLPARRGDHLVVENFSGSLLVGVGVDDEVRLEGTAGARSDLRLERRGSRISVEPPARRMDDREMDARLRIPAWMALTVRGRDLDVEVRDVAAAVEVRNVEGDVLLAGIRGGAVVSTVDGTVTVRDARGDLALGSQGDDVTVEGAVAGTVRAESGDGDVVLLEVDAREVWAETLDGDVILDGPVRPGGSYRVSVHDGDAEVGVPADVGLEVSVSTFDGEFLSDFPVTVERFRAGGSFRFTLGDGGARLEIQVFDGEIRLRERR